MKSPSHPGPTKPDMLQGQGIHAPSGSHLQCRTPQSHSSQTPGTPHRFASPLSARPHCILYGDSGTNGLSLSWAEALLWPRAWWGHPEEVQMENQRSVLRSHPILPLFQNPHSPKTSLLFLPRRIGVSETPRFCGPTTISLKRQAVA